MGVRFCQVREQSGVGCPGGCVGGAPIPEGVQAHEEDAQWGLSTLVGLPLARSSSSL